MKEIKGISDKDLLDDTRIDRLFAPRDPRSDLLVMLLDAEAFAPNNAVTVSESEITRELEATGRIIVDHKTYGVYLTDLGFLVADGERLLREKEKKIRE